MNPQSMTSVAKPPRLSIPQAADLLELGMFPEALAIIERLPSDLRSAPAARRIAARAATGLGRWRQALEEATVLREGNEADRTAAAEAFQALAAEACNRGRENDARRLVTAAVRTRPEQLELMLSDARFPKKFLDWLVQRWR